MATFLFDQIIFGPVRSRRLGISLGINLLPQGAKFCNFNCLYCECGWSSENFGKQLPGRDVVKHYLGEKLRMMNASNLRLDAITYAGNGEPTLHPEFEGIIDDSIAMRNHYFPEAKIAVLSNSTMLDKPNIIEALKRVDDRILKLDSAIESTFQLINRPGKKISVNDVIDWLKALNGKFTLQTLFIKGEYEGQPINNTSQEEIDAWLNVLDEIKPQKVMIYTFARDTPHPDLEKIGRDKLDEIASLVEKKGIETVVSY
ncbi:MAG: radical SAM protein [Marinilabiliales bacterium]|nr:MAG: radical SAM protein [Marinilabiliales bacterium]